MAKTTTNNNVQTKNGKQNAEVEKGYKTTTELSELYPKSLTVEQMFTAKANDARIKDFNKNASSRIWNHCKTEVAYREDSTEKVISARDSDINNVLALGEKIKAAQAEVKKVETAKEKNAEAIASANFALGCALGMTEKYAAAGKLACANIAVQLGVKIERAAGVPRVATVTGAVKTKKQLILQYMQQNNANYDTALKAVEKQIAEQESDLRAEIEAEMKASKATKASAPATASIGAKNGAKNNSKKGKK